MRSSIALVVAMFSATPLLAQEAPPRGDTIAGKNAAAAEKKVCIKETATGSIMEKRVCHTKAEWAAIRGQDTKNTEQISQRPVS